MPARGGSRGDIDVGLNYTRPAASDAEAFIASLAGCGAVVHIATEVPRDFSALDAWEVNTRLRTEGTRRLLDASLAAGVRHCVLERVALAYPDGGDRWLDESTPLDDSPPARLSARR